MAEDVKIRLLGVKKTTPTEFYFPWMRKKVSFDKDGFAQVPIFAAERIKKEAPDNYEYPVVHVDTAPQKKQAKEVKEVPLEDKTKEQAFVEAIK
jgi:hypothetical protein